MPVTHCFLLDQTVIKWTQRLSASYLGVLKIASENNPALAFRISQRIPIINKGIAGGLAALYDNVSEHRDDPELLGEVLEAFGKISGYSQLRMGNALRRSLPCLDRKFGSAKVIAMVIRVYKTIEDEQAIRWYCQLNFMKTQKQRLRQDESTFR